jgi:hypothetical protein
MHILFRIVWNKMSHRHCFSTVILKNIETLLDISKEIGLELNTEKTKCVVAYKPVAKQWFYK